MFNYPFFENRTIKSYKSLILRASGQDAVYSRIRDNLITTLFEEGDNGLPEDRAVVVQAHKQVVVLLNGKYWGVYDFMERITEDFVAERFHLSNPDAVDLLFGNGKPKLRARRQRLAGLYGNGGVGGQPRFERPFELRPHLLAHGRGELRDLHRRGDRRRQLGHGEPQVLAQPGEGQQVALDLL